MTRSLRSRSRTKVGLPPGTPVYTGPERSAPVTLRLFAYDAKEVLERADATLAEALAERPGMVRWLDVVGVHEVGVLSEIGAAFGLHPLVVEDIASVGQRPKVEVFDTYVFVVLRMLRLGEAGALESEQLSLVLSENVVLSFQEVPGDTFDGVRERLRKTKGRIRQQGADYLAYSLIDTVVDGYFALLEHYSDRAEALEEAVLDDPGPDFIREVNALKHGLLVLRRAVWPLRDLVSALQRDGAPLFSREVLTYLRDVHDHSVQVIETVEALREILSSLHDLYLSHLSQRMNEIMKTLTIVGTIFIPLTFLVGIYGMNFDYMPELHWPWAYPALLGLMLVLALGMLAYFKGKGWL